MGGHIQQRPWTPTKRRGPIAAEFSSPGPASVALPGLIGKQAHTQILANIVYHWGRRKEI